MAGAAGLVPSILTIAKATKLVGQLLSDLSPLIHNPKGVPDDVCEFGSRLRQYDISVKLTKLNFQKLCENPLSSDVVSFLEKERVDKFLEESWRRVAKRLRRVQRKLPSIEGHTRAVVIVKWAVWLLSKKDEMREVFPLLESVKTFLSFVSSSLQLMIMLGQEDETPERGVEIDTLKAVIKSQAELIRNLQVQQGRHSRAPNSSQNDMSAAGVHVNLKISKVVIQLAESLTQTGKVPEASSASHSTLRQGSAIHRGRAATGPNRHASPDPSDRHETVVKPAQEASFLASQAQTLSRGVRRRRVPRQNTRSHSETTQESMIRSASATLEKPTDHSSPISERELYREIPDNDNKASPGEKLKHQREARDNPNKRLRSPIASRSPTPSESSRASLTSSDTPVVAESPITPLTPTSPEAATSQYSDVRPRSNIIHISETKKTALIGYVSKPGGKIRKYITAILKPDLEENLISTAEAHRLGLEVESAEPGEGEAKVRFGRDGKTMEEPIVGSVELTWWPTVHQYRQEFKVRLWACDHIPHRIILGSPFEKRQRHYTRKNQSVDGVV